MHKLLSVLSVTILVALSSSLFAAERPNVIIFLADDLGYADVGFNGCEDIPTPHIDSIAEKGLGRAAGCPTALLQIRASQIKAHGSSGHGFAGR